MAPLITVVRYYSRWDLDNHDGRIALYGATNNQLDNRVYSNPEEFKLIVEMLRYEKPLWFDSGTKHLRTGYGSSGEPVGEDWLRRYTPQTQIHTDFRYERDVRRHFAGRKGGDAM